ncbi:transcriptional regulator, HxlR family [Bifidobacterium ramosum]|uniref:MarR family transcriptional regulator n=1 Tax=Bifidobacterium ramosum TaxID=1798158 RepID=A0A6L4WXA2_9BIFI|nr:helix-turn-helix domain-containing protein [Bifidobacterium ramosum]KAB8286839.1 transcriptional regulator, HxlR family [Bifidobacterium ramosum]NEG72677.1 MarR family transcriptional regulator [Bifidobacterium ramosum]
MNEQVESNGTAARSDAASVSGTVTWAASRAGEATGDDAGNLTAPTCAIGYAFKAIEGKWKLPVMYVLSVRGAARYNEIKRELGITNMMLTNTLRDLEEYGLVSRTQYNEVPPRVEYALTANGYAIIPALKEFEKWGQRLLDARGSAGQSA